jgi:hypothetical protein
MNPVSTFIIGLTLAGSGLAAHAAQDPAKDLLPSFTGTPSAGLDLIEAQVSFNPGHDSFTLEARTLGSMTDLPTSAFVFGFNRGGTTVQPFGPIGFADIAFNATALLRGDGRGSIGGTSIDVQVQGDKLRAVLPASLLPSLGLAPQDYTWALWAVDLAVTGLPRNADFISADNLNVTAVPEPSSLALMLAGMAAVGGVVRSRRSR